MVAQLAQSVEHETLNLRVVGSSHVLGNFFAALGFPDSSVGTESTCNALESESEVAQSCLTLGDPMDCSLTGSSVHEIFQARVLEWVAIAFSRGSSQPRDRTRVSRIVGKCFTV